MKFRKVSSEAPCSSMQFQATAFHFLIEVHNFRTRWSAQQMRVQLDANSSPVSLQANLCTDVWEFFQIWNWNEIHSPSSLTLPAQLSGESLVHPSWCSDWAHVQTLDRRCAIGPFDSAPNFFSEFSCDFFRESYAISPVDCVWGSVFHKLSDCFNSPKSRLRPYQFRPFFQWFQWLDSSD